MALRCAGQWESEMQSIEQLRDEAFAVVRDLHANYGCDYRSEPCVLIEAAGQYRSTEICERNAIMAAMEFADVFMART
jgi:hypothetical protein